MRTARLPALVALVVAVGLLAAGPAGASVSQRRAPRLATEVCESMVREAVEAVVAHPLPTQQVGAWTVPDKQYQCTYDVGGGTLVMQVDVERNGKGAKTAFRTARSAFATRERLHGIGQQAFQTPDGTLVARKDNFVLRVDPAAVPAGINKRDVAFAAAVAVMSCWPG